MQNVVDQASIELIIQSLIAFSYGSLNSTYAVGVANLSLSLLSIRALSCGAQTLRNQLVYSTLGMLPRHLAMHLYTHRSLCYGIGYSSINWNQISRMEMRGLDGCEERWRVNGDVLARL